LEITLNTEFSASMEQEWNDLLDRSNPHVPFLRFEYLQAWWQHRGGGEWPQEAQLAILLGHKDGVLAGIAPCFIAEHEGEKRLLLLGSIEISDYLDLISEEADRVDFVKSLIAYVESSPTELGKIGAIDLYNVLEDSPTMRAFEEIDPSKARLKIEQLQHSPYIKLAGDWETYLSQIDKKQRHEIRRKMRRAAEAEVPAEVYFSTEVERLEADMDVFLGLMAQDKDKCTFLTPAMREQMKAIIRAGFGIGCLQLVFLKIGEEFAAGYLNADYLNRIWVYNSGLDSRFMSYSPGWVLLGHLLKWANENGREEFDFMRGNEEYKYKFGAIDRFVMRVRLQVSPQR
jgi:CelD/BcsL family acetyltransferase involved in cellulose biosynthesis